MERTENITIRVSPHEKERFAEAAAQRGQSITAFIVESAMSAAESEPAGPLEAFRAACQNAASGRANYRLAGMHLANALRSAKPKSLSTAAWRDQIRQIRKLLDGKDDAAIWQWFEEHLPDSIALVPKRDIRRRQSFLRGLREANEQGQIG